ncbi:hypothetical protein B7P43_G08821 [Cryptotermes secundus]|uniref:T-box domain-containing protein n=1 Tax=Cryptotermes secundus TaxID=105785 RepID=A0A2J7RJK2_9NEOP|nr:T-box-containing protein TBX6L [Cryptotermes secundus]PNF41015.1 hypothetical protein B7P43_G08821 [Cryptotermes secundus]
MRDGASEDEGGCVVTEALWGPGKPELKGVKMALLGGDLWRRFHDVHTEMIITKLGRNMFPVITLEVSGLEPEARYFIVMEICLSSDRRYKFVGAEWKPTGKAEPQLAPSSRIFIHQDSPATGTHWMREPVKMKSAKLTNNPLNRSGHVVLTSMHKYVPRIHVIKTSDIMALSWSPTATFTFPETEFIAVTAYQNEQVTALKIDNNPFAKGFRENGLSFVKRKQNETVSASHRKRPCPERSASPSVDCVQTASLPAAEDWNNNGHSTEHVLPVIQDQNESNSVLSINCLNEEISTAVTNINLNSNSLNYPCQGLYQPYYQQHNQPVWKCPYLPPQTPLPPQPSLFPPFLLPCPCYILPYIQHYMEYPAQSYLSHLNSQPYDYSVREKSS